MRSNRCANCGKPNHIKPKCKDPVTSCGLVCIAIPDANLRDSFVRNYNIVTGAKQNTRNLVDIIKYNSTNNRNLDKLCSYSKSVKFLLVQRRHSYSLVEISRGNFYVDDKAMMDNLMGDLSYEECCMIVDNDYREFMLRVTGADICNGSHTVDVSAKYSCLQNLLRKYISSKHRVDFPHLEWGFPKGRREKNESNLRCGIREFCEESSYASDQIMVLSSMNEIKEIFRGTDNIMYQMIYNLSLLLDFDHEPVVNKYNSGEVAKISWMSIEDLNVKLRHDQVEKKKIIIEIYKFIVNVLELAPLEEARPVTVASL